MPLLRNVLLCLLPLVPSVLSDSQCKPQPDRCKAVPGTPGWPSPQTWARLNESVSGRLLQPPPPGAVCHAGQPTYNEAACAAVRTAWTSYEFHTDHPISTVWNQWNNHTCLPWDGNPCSSQGYPVFVINATTVDHVKKGVDFARKHNVRLVIKSTGHDYVGRSNAPNSLSIWTHNIKGFETHASFKPKRCSVTIDSTAVTVGAGMQMNDLYGKLDAINQTIVGGGGRSVSVGGYVTGAGHGMLAPHYGLAADQVLEMEIVTPKGDIVTANECQNADLFWAMRGGGGSTFGVMTSVTMKTFPAPQVMHVDFALLASGNSTATRTIFDMVAYVVSQLPSLGDQGLSGYSFFFPLLKGILSFFPLPGDTPDDPAAEVGGFFMSAALMNATADDMRRIWAPVLAHVNATWPNQFVPILETKSYPSFYAWFQEHYDTTPAGQDGYAVSWLLDAESLTRDLNKNSQAFERFAGGDLGTAYLVSGKGVHNAQPRGGGNAVLPAWRKAYIHATGGVRSIPFNATSAAEARTELAARTEALKQLDPDSGAYMNEASPFLDDWQRAFWGANYDRLLRIKRTVDPDDVLWCTPCVGSERWEQVGDRLCRVK